MKILKNLFERNNEEPETKLVFSDGKQYGVDVSAIEKLCFKSDNEDSNSVEVTEGYEKNDLGKMDFSSKVIREIKSTGNAQNDTMRYDLFKSFLTVVLEKRQFMYGSLENELKFDISFNIAFNTLLTYNVIYEITE